LWNECKNVIRALICYAQTELLLLKCDYTAAFGLVAIPFLLCLPEEEAFWGCSRFILKRKLFTRWIFDNNIMKIEMACFRHRVMELLSICAPAILNNETFCVDYLYTYYHSYLLYHDKSEKMRLFSFFLLYEYKDVDIYFVVAKIVHYTKYSQIYYELNSIPLPVEEWIGLTVKLIDKYFKGDLKPLSHE